MAGPSQGPQPPACDSDEHESEEGSETIGPSMSVHSLSVWSAWLAMLVNIVSSHPAEQKMAKWLAGAGWGHLTHFPHSSSMQGQVL
jgi:hypothetical protein